MRRQPLGGSGRGASGLSSPARDGREGAWRCVKALDTDFPEEDKFERLKGRGKAKRAPAAFLNRARRLR